MTGLVYTFYFLLIRRFGKNRSQWWRDGGPGHSVNSYLFIGPSWVVEDCNKLFYIELQTLILTVIHQQYKNMCHKAAQTRPASVRHHDMKEIFILKIYISAVQAGVEFWVRTLHCFKTKCCSPWWNWRAFIQRNMYYWEMVFGKIRFLIFFLGLF